jgi:pseudouridine kinase
MPPGTRAPRPAAPRAVAAGDGPVVVIGGCNVDLSGRARGPVAAGDSSPGQVHSAPGGVARNIAENLARLGHAVRLVTGVGDDPAGRWLRQATSDAGVDVRGCRAIAGAASAHYLSLHDARGRLLHAVSDMAVLDHLTPARLAAERPHLRRAAAIVVDANLREDSLAWLFAQGFAAPIHADAVSAAKAPRLQPVLHRLHTLKLNRAEAAALGAPPLRSPAQRVRAAAWFLERGVRRLALSLGEGGLLLATADAVLERPAWDVPAHNATGAGDALMAGLVHAALAGWPPARAADFALGCAALTLSHAATNHPDLGERAVRLLQRRCRRPESTR